MLMIKDEGTGLGLGYSEIMNLEYERFNWLCERYSKYIEDKADRMKNGNRGT